MKANHSDIFLSTLLFLLFLHQITFLVESIYMLNLLHTSMDLRVLGILFLLMPVLLFFIPRASKSMYLTLGIVIIGCALLSPLVSTPYRILSAGLGAGTFLLYLGLQLSDREISEHNWGLALALATLVSIAMRALGSTLDISLTGDTKFIGWLMLAITLRLMFVKYNAAGKSTEGGSEASFTSGGSTVLLIFGIFGAILLIYFAFSSPGVIARWTGAGYGAVNIILSAALLVWILVGLSGAGKQVVKRGLLLTWNLSFLAALILTIALHTIKFPVTPGSDPVVVTESSTIALGITYLMLLLSPVVFVNISLFTQGLRVEKPSALALSFSLASLFIIFSVFMLIFTNVWGYVGEVSRFFRNRFYLPFTIIGIIMILPYVFRGAESFVEGKFNVSESRSRSIAVMAVSMFALCILGVYFTRPKAGTLVHEQSKLTLMTYNIQQGVDLFGNKNFEGQLGLVRKVNPDILCLQESDAARISGGNSDVVRYFTNHLNYYCYYGPKTVTGTYGTAILSRFPLGDCRTLFTYSDKDEIGTAVARVTIGERSITVANSHPAGGKECRQAHIDMLKQVAEDSGPVIAMGDYNFRQDSPWYLIITTVLQDAWLSLYPDAIGQVEEGIEDNEVREDKGSSGILLGDGLVDMRERIDHIFVSDDFDVIEAHYLPTPESQTDHPAHWVVVEF